ncbi:hypothetical protein FF38_08483 [Lucilia cuprina]|uniref:Uncharacterized protein n=1 Tax=Lucilia cuprina TaxID=7375 RepID=A0A0L0CG54_LUCCU|nr:hypothetical protein FF38_08483 [Lucilia cuprina]
METLHQTSVIKLQFKTFNANIVKAITNPWIKPILSLENKDMTYKMQRSKKHIFYAQDLAH